MSLDCRWFDVAERLNQVGSDLLDLACAVDDQTMLATGMQGFRFAGGSKLGLGKRLSQPESLAPWQLEELRKDIA